MNEREHEDQRPVVTLAGGSADEGASLSRELDRAGAMLLAELIEADEVLHTRLDLAGGTATVASGVGQDPQFELGEALGRFGHLHPAVLSYLAEGDDRRPRRISDVCGSSAWRNNPAFLEVFGDSRAIHQLSLVTELSDRVGVGWVLTRSGRDFSVDDVAIATRALPHLTRLAALSRRLRPEPPTQPLLTAREAAVLDLLATGAAARTIARTLGISIPTTRKHLAHIYEKLGVHDRLSAVLMSTGIR